MSRRMRVDWLGLASCALTSGAVLVAWWYVLSRSDSNQLFWEGGGQWFDRTFPFWAVRLVSAFAAVLGLAGLVWKPRAKPVCMVGTGLGLFIVVGTGWFVALPVAALGALFTVTELL